MMDVRKLSSGEDVRKYTRLSLALALQEAPPVIGPGQEPPLGGARRQVLVVVGSEKNMFPGWIGLHTCSRTAPILFSEFHFIAENI